MTETCRTAKMEKIIDRTSEIPTHGYPKDKPKKIS